MSTPEMVIIYWPSNECNHVCLQMPMFHSVGSTKNIFKFDSNGKSDHL